MTCWYWSQESKEEVDFGSKQANAAAKKLESLGAIVYPPGKKDEVDCHKSNLQPNAGEDIPSAIKSWRQDNGGTHKVMATVYVKKDGTKVTKGPENGKLKVELSSIRNTATSVCLLSS